MVSFIKNFFGKISAYLGCAKNTSNQQKIEEIRQQGFAKIFDGENELFEEAITKYPEIVHILLLQWTLFLKLIDHFSNNRHSITEAPDQSLQCLNDLKQALLSGPLYALRGNIRACFMEMRFAIETISVFAYLMKEESKQSVEEAEKIRERYRQEYDEKLVEEKVKLDKEIAHKAYKCLEKKYPEENEHLEEMKKKWINPFFAHGDFFRAQDLDVKARGICISMYDSSRKRECLLEVTISVSSTIARQACSIICKIMERSDHNMDEYKIEMNAVIAAHEKYFKNKEKKGAIK